MYFFLTLYRLRFFFFDFFIIFFTFTPYMYWFSAVKVEEC